MRNANVSVLFVPADGGYSQLLCADEKLEWSREPFLDSEPQPLNTNSRARNGRRSDDYQAWFKHSRYAEIYAENARLKPRMRRRNRHSKSLTFESICREICRTQSRSDAAIHRRNYIMARYK